MNKKIIPGITGIVAGLLLFALLNTVPYEARMPLFIILLYVVFLSILQIIWVDRTRSSSIFGIVIGMGSLILAILMGNFYIGGGYDYKSVLILAPPALILLVGSITALKKS